MSKQEIDAMAKLIIETHNGKAYFNFTEASKIIGCGINTVPKKLNDAGVLVSRVGPSKRISAYDLAETMNRHRVSAVK
jgi:hypothetical protein